MPNFASSRSGPKIDKELQARPRQLVGLNDAKINPGEKPLTVFRGLMKDFAQGIRALKDGRSASQPRSSSSAVPAKASGATLRLSENITKMPDSPQPLYAKASFRGSDDKLSRGRAPDITTDSRVVDQAKATTISGLNISKAVLPAELRERSRSGKFKPVTGADKEAYKQVLQVDDKGDPAHVPATARLAQVLRADALVRNGEGRGNPKLHALAQTIREGRKRDVADLDPAQVKNIVSSALGGGKRAEQMLGSSTIQRLIERHSTRIQALQGGLKEKNSREKSIIRDADMKVPAGSRAVENPPSAQHASNVSNVASTPSREPQVIAPYEDAYEPALAHMASTNDDVHTGSVAAAENQSRIQDFVAADRVLANHGSAAKAAAGNTASPAGAQAGSGGGGTGAGAMAGHDSTLSAGIPAAGGGGSRVMEFSSPSPTGGAGKALAQAMDGASKGEQRKELTGKLKLMGSNGQALGEALIEGEM